MKKLLFILSTFCCILTVSALDIAINRKACVQIVVNPAAGNHKTSYYYVNTGTRFFRPDK